MNSNRHLGTVPSFSELLVRADETVLHFLLGKSTVRLMQATKGSGISMQDFRDALLEIRPPWTLLEDHDARQLVLEMLYSDEVESLVRTTRAPSSDIAQLTQWLSPNSNRFASLLASLEIYRPSNVQDAPSRPSLQDCVPDHCLFPHQRDAMVRVQAALKAYPHRVLLHMPTGSGKTRTAMQVAAHHLQGDVDTTVCWLATSEELFYVRSNTLDHGLDGTSPLLGSCICNFDLVCPSFSSIGGLSIFLHERLIRPNQRTNSSTPFPQTC